jgi:WD40 repeat protein
LEKLDSERFAAAGSDGILNFYNIISRKNYKRIVSIKASIISMKGINDDLLLLGLSDGNIQVWKGSNEKCVGIMTGHKDHINSIIVLN